MVFDFELHKAHVGRMGELCDDTQSWEQSVRKKNRETQREKMVKKNNNFSLYKRLRLQSEFGQSGPEKGLDVDDGLCVGHVVLLCDHGALLVNHHHGVGEGHSAPQQTVQTVREKGERTSKDE